MSDILDKILARPGRRSRRPPCRRTAGCTARLRRRGCACARLLPGLQARPAAGETAVIAEVKKASPSRAWIRPDFHLAAIRSYAAAGATCLSVLTDGISSGVRRLSAGSPRRAALPVLRKDFTVDAYRGGGARPRRRLHPAHRRGTDDASLADWPSWSWRWPGRCRKRTTPLSLQGVWRCRRRRGTSVLIGVNNRDLRTSRCRSTPLGPALRSWRAGAGGRVASSRWPTGCA